MKTVSLFNVPIDLAQELVKSLRARASDKLLAGAPMSEVDALTWEIRNIEESIQFQMEADQEATDE